MILCEHGKDTPEAIEEMLVFVGQMNAAGQEVKIHAGSINHPLPRNSQYEIAPFLCDAHQHQISKLIILGADTLCDQKMGAFRQLKIHPETQIYAFGNFEQTQPQISVLSRLSYVLGKDPELIDLSGTGTFTDVSSPTLGVPVRLNPKKRPRVMLLAPSLENEQVIESVYAFSLSRKFDAVIVTNGKSKELWQKKYGFDCEIFYYGELPPEDLSARADVCILVSNIEHNIRAKAIFCNLIVSGAPIVDCTQIDSSAPSESFAVRGPTDITHLSEFLTQEILPNITELGNISRNSALSQEVSAAKLMQKLQLIPSSTTDTHRATDSCRVLFVPTNGVGLGHAQRCSLVADKLQPSTKARFAAFPSCMPMLNRYGFDGIPLVSRSELHSEPHANDLINYQRLHAASGNHDVLVFDGGYVFDSIFRVIAKQKLRGVWIRRGLWQAEQNNSIALDREKIFERVIVPMEAFDELNHSYSHGTRLKAVGPIVQRPDPKTFDREKLRERLRQRFNRDFTNLTITMLGGGVAADRTAQVQAICAGMENRDDTLNLVVTWPTARVDPGWFCWKNSKVVRTHHANQLVSACDLFISAVGYNSFHEAMYNQVPSIFIPQMAAFMDDQRARAESAAERGAAILIEPTQMSSLDREIDLCLNDSKVDDIRNILANLELPETGSAETARYIEEIANDCG